MAVQGQVKLAVGETASQPVGRVHRERGLADPGHPADRADPHNPTASGQAIQPFRRPVKLGPAAGEAGDVPRQPAGRRRGERPQGRALPGRHHIPGQAPPARRSHEQLCDRPGQTKRPRQQHRGLLAGGPVDAPLQVTDRARAHAGRFRQLLLRQPGFRAQPPQQPSECKRRFVRHRRIAPHALPVRRPHPANRTWTHCTQTALTIICHHQAGRETPRRRSATVCRRGAPNWEFGMPWCRDHSHHCVHRIASLGAITITTPQAQHREAENSDAGCPRPLHPGTGRRRCLVRPCTNCVPVWERTERAAHPRLLPPICARQSRA